MFNTIKLTGTINEDPEISLTRGGQRTAKFTLMASSMWREEIGWDEHSACFDVLVFCEETVRWIKAALKKNDLVYVDGKLSYRFEKDALGGNHWSTFVVVSRQNECVQHLYSPNPELGTIDVPGFKNFPESAETEEVLCEPMNDNFQLIQQSQQR
jgi:single-stranded DNA-binding protein